MNLYEILEQAIHEEASDVFIVAGLPVSFRKHNVVYQVNEDKLFKDDTNSLLTQIYKEAGDRDLNLLLEKGEYMAVRLLAQRRL